MDHKTVCSRFGNGHHLAPVRYSVTPLLRYSVTNDVTFLSNDVTDRYFLFTGNGPSNGPSNGSYFLLRYSFTLLLCYCVTPLPRYPVAPLPRCSGAPVLRCSVAPSPRYSVIPLFRYSVSPQIYVAFRCLCIGARYWSLE